MGTNTLESMIKSFCIGGDSWGCGEWQKDNYLPGGKQYDLHRLLLAANFIVSDISLPGEHNPYTIKRLAEHIASSPIDYDYVIWFQSDPLRRPDTIIELERSAEFSLDYNWFVNTNNRYLDEDYCALNNIGKKIYCIGGLSKINIDLLSKYSNLVPLVISLPELFFPDKPHPNLCVGEWMKHLGRTVTSTELDKLLADHNEMTKWSTEEYSKYFKLTDSHPNKEGYKLLYNFIVSNIQNF
jgi:hypothetical protein